MKNFTLIAVVIIFSGMSMLTGCKKKNSTAKTKPATENTQHDGHDHSSHSKDDGHGH